MEQEQSLQQQEEEKRRFERDVMVYYQKVLNRYNGKLFGFMLDIHQHGTRILCKEAIETGKVYHLRVLIQVGTNTTHADFDVRGVRCEMNTLLGHHECGFEIIQIKPEHFNSISQLVSLYALHA